MGLIFTWAVNPALVQHTGVADVQPDKKLRCRAPFDTAGGGGINVARAAQRLGAETRALWSQGGAGGTLLARILDQAGLDHYPVAITGETRRNLLVEDDDGRQFRFILPGPRWTDKDSDAWAEAVAESANDLDYLVVSGSLPPDAPTTLIERLLESLERSTQVILDTSGPALAAAARLPITIATPNRRELGQWADRELDDDETLLDTAREMRERSAFDALVITLGADGALLVEADGHEWIPGLPVEVVSVVGAGDSLTGGLVTALVTGLPLSDAAAYGVAAGTAAVTTPVSELCHLEDTWNFFRDLQRRRGREAAIEPSHGS